MAAAARWLATAAEIFSEAFGQLDFNWASELAVSPGVDAARVAVYTTDPDQPVQVLAVP